MKTILDKQQLHLAILRLAHQLLENHLYLNDVAFIGIQPRGVKVGTKLMECIQQLCPGEKVQYGILDITFYRDDVRDELHVANKTDIPFSIEGKKVILIDDVLYTGRTIRAALDAIQDFGRPQKVELCVLVDRRFNRELPIQPDYCGKAIDSNISQKVKVEWDKEEVVLY
ncbi:MAG TPA: bifunctional pyr operon transcriptional regulator/uracil phosphoribosyltransferase PyrR [Ferruginibacter sp.]|nr:bifunctional pyr operon transcriptional regulator/uracil phosphoribosyltransferase PyrR [Ferruginibacter sp.]